MVGFGISERSLRKHLLARLSDRLRRHVDTCTDLRTEWTDPIDAAYASPERPFVIDVPVLHCRGLHALAFPMDPFGRHPFIATVRAFGEGLTDPRTSPLSDYYRGYRPQTAAEVLGLPLAEVHPELARGPFAATLPWDFRSPVEAQAFWQMICALDYRRHGFDLDHRHGWKAWGPVTDVALQAEFLRLLRAYRSILRQGYLRHSAHDGDIGGRILRSGSETRILLEAGQHRAAVLAALGWTGIPLRMTSSIVDRADVSSWPNVRRGFFTRQQALAVFDRVFAGRQPFAVPVLVRTEA